MIVSLFIVISVIFGILFIQHNHYEFKIQLKQLEDVINKSEELDKMKKEFEEYKKRVDTLTLKAGFKL